MKSQIKGKCWVFGDNVDTDQMAPGSTISLAWEERKTSLFPLKPGFATAVSEGDILVAGENWGCGSSREQAVEHLQLLGVGAVIAESYARIFFRNAIARALPAITCPGIKAAVAEGDELAIDWDKFTVHNLSRGLSLEAVPYNDEMKSIVEQGGMINMLKQRLGSSHISSLTLQE